MHSVLFFPYNIWNIRPDGGLETSRLPCQNSAFGSVVTTKQKSSFPTNFPWRSFRVMAVHLVDWC